MVSGRPEGDLVDLVFSWSLEDIFNKNLYKNKVEKIPATFQSTQQYLESYVFPLLEEVRAEFSPALEVLSRAPISEIQEIEKTSPCEEELEYLIKFDFQKNDSDKNSNVVYEPTVGDIFVFSDWSPVSVNDFNKYRRPYIIAFVSSTGDDESKEISDLIVVKTSKFIDAAKCRQKKAFFAIYLLNIITYDRMWRALNFRTCPSIIKEVLYTSSSTGGSCQRCSIGENGNLCIDLHSMNLNESQIHAILSSISASQCYHKPMIKLIWGPPGTGKTKTVGILLRALLTLECKTITCAPTNVAIKEVSKRLLSLLEEECQDDICSLGDVVLFGNNKRMKVEEDLLEIFLDYRIERLVECFVPLTGWNHQVISMIDFLEDSLTQYENYLEIEKEKEKEGGTEIEEEKGKKKDDTKFEKEKEKEEGGTRKDPLVFREFVRNQFNAMSKALTICLKTLCTHHPTCFISKNFEDILRVLYLLEHFGRWLRSDNYTDKEIEDIFRQISGVTDEFYQSLDVLKVWETGSCTIGLMHKILANCLTILRRLRQNLILPSFYAEDSIREFCLSNATLIFCTASSSSKLHSVGMVKPMELLVIDEAAQLKECETLIPLQLGIRHAILIGDECQLPAMVRSKVSEEAGFGRSLFERFSSLGHEKSLLNMQYRMHPSISLFPNCNFYSNQILDAPNVQDNSYERHYLPGMMYGTYSFISIPYGKEVFDDGHSRKNIIEVSAVLHILKRLHEVSVASRQRLSVGVISPYTAQIVAIKKKLGDTYKMNGYFVVNVKSVDGFQGGEEDIIILSTVRSNGNGSVGFLSNCQRTNVALTRAKHCLWILGNGVTLLNSGSIWERLVLDAKDRGCFFSIDQDRQLAEAILPAIIELDQLDGLFSMDALLFSRSRWKVLFTEDFKRSFERIKRPKFRSKVVELLLKLADSWRPVERNPDFIYGSSFQLMQHCRVEKHYLIWTVEILKLSNYIQVLKFWDILCLEEVPELVQYLNNTFVKYSETYIYHCRLKSFEGNSEVPMTWETCPDIHESKNPLKTVTEPEEDLSNRFASLDL